MIGKLLVTGLPRTRSAWIAALLTANGAPCLHEPAVAYGRPVALKEMFADGFRGIAYPCAALVYRDELVEAFADYPVVVIDRDEAESRRELAEWSGLQFTDEQWRRAIEAHLWVEDNFDVRRIRFADLNNFDVADRMVRYLTGSPLDPRVWRVFDTLDVQQHKAKALQRMNLEARCQS